MPSVAKFLAKNIATVLLIIVAVAATIFVVGKVEGVWDFLFPDKVIAEHKFTIVTSVQKLGHLVTVKHEVAKTNIKVEIHRGFLNAGYYSANTMPSARSRQALILTRLTKTAFASGTTPIL